MSKQFAGVIEGGQRYCHSEAYATPSDLSLRTMLSGRSGLICGKRVSRSENDKNHAHFRGASK